MNKKNFYKLELEKLIQFEPNTRCFDCGKLEDITARQNTCTLGIHQQRHLLMLGMLRRAQRLRGQRQLHQVGHPRRVDGTPSQINESRGQSKT